MTRKSGGDVRTAARLMGMADGAEAEPEWGLVISTPEAVAQKTPRLKRTRGYRRFARRLLSESFVAIMERMAQESIGGSLAHTRYLFEIGGLTEELRNEGQAKGEPNLGELIRDEIERRRAEAAAARLGGGDMGRRDERGDDIAEREIAGREIAERDVPGREGDDDIQG